MGERNFAVTCLVFFLSYGNDTKSFRSNQKIIEKKVDEREKNETVIKLDKTLCLFLDLRAPNSIAVYYY